MNNIQYVGKPKLAPNREMNPRQLKLVEEIVEQTGNNNKDITVRFLNSGTAMLGDMHRGVTISTYNRIRGQWEYIGRVKGKDWDY